MEPIVYLDRTSGKDKIEKVYGESIIKFLYGKDFLSKVFGAPLLYFSAKIPLFSIWYGWWQKSFFSKQKIKPFIEAFQVDPAEFLDPVESFNTFNDFFIRKLKTEKRPIAPGDDTAIIPADARYWFYQDISHETGFIVKGETFSIQALLGNDELAQKYAKGSMVIARLCPTDYHRFHFPCACIPGVTRLINGWLFSVNPLAVKQNIHIFTQNKRTVCELGTEKFGKVLFLEIGATNVGSINETYTPNIFQPKGAEKGYFSFGASSLILLFEPDKIVFDSDLLKATQNGLEIRCLMGQSMGKCIYSTNLNPGI